MPRTAFLTLLTLLVSVAVAVKMFLVLQETKQLSINALVTSAKAQEQTEEKSQANKASEETENEPAIDPGVLSLEDRLRLGQLPEELFDQLRSRETKIKDREQSLMRLESILAITEKRLQDRQQALESTRVEIKILIDQYESIRNKENARLVDIYSNIEPKRAAAIFNDLDVEITVDLMRTMSPRRVAPILSLMDPEKARLITQLLSDE